MHRHASKSSSADADAALDMMYRIKRQERKNGPEQAEKWPTQQCSIADRPMASETAIFVNWQQFLCESAESLTHVRRDTSQQRAVAAGLAVWFQMICHPMVGKIDRVATNDGHIEPSSGYAITVGDRTNIEQKVNIDVIAIPIDGSRPVSLDNIAGVLFRAMAVDWDFTFGNALNWTLLGNSRIPTHNVSRSNLGPNNAGRLAIRRVYEKCGSKMYKEFSEELLYDIVVRHHLYQAAVEAWANDRLEKDIDGKYAKHAPVELQKKRDREIIEHRRRKASRGRGAAAIGGDDEAGEDDDEDDGYDAGEVQLSEAERDAVRDKIRSKLLSSEKYPPTVMMNVLHLGGKATAPRRNHADGIISSSIHVYNSMVLAQTPVTAPITLGQTLDAMCYAVSSASNWVNTAGVAFCPTDQLPELARTAREIDQRGMMNAQIDGTSIAPERMLTLANALQLALEAGGDPRYCDLREYYGVRGDSLALGPAYDPCNEYSRLTFEPLKIRPTWGRTEGDIAAMFDGMVQTELLMAPWFGRVPNPENTRSLSNTQASFSKLRKYRFWFAEDTILDDIDRSIELACAGNVTSARLIRQLYQDVMDRAQLPPDYDPNSEMAALQRLQVPDLQRIEQIESVGGGLGRNVATEATLQKRECQSRAAARIASSIKAPGVCEFDIEYEEMDLGANVHYRSNFSIASDRMQPWFEKVLVLRRIAPQAFATLMPRFREYCARQFSRIYVGGSFNNGDAMVEVRKYEMEHWSNPKLLAGSGAYRRVAPFTTALSHFGNRVAGDIMTLCGLMDLTFCPFFAWTMLTATRAIAFTRRPKIHQINFTRAGEGKSYMVEGIMKLSIKGTHVSKIVSSAKAELDGMAVDDMLVVMDEAPMMFTHPNKIETAQDAMANNLLRSIMSSGQISVARSDKGRMTTHFTADHAVTFITNTNTIEAPRDGERSLLTRISIVRNFDQLAVDSIFYSQHRVQPLSDGARKPDVRKQWQSTQALQAIMAKMEICGALPEVDTTVVSCLLEYLSKRIDAFYPSWLVAMRASGRVASLVAGYAMFNAQALVFNSCLSPFSPENTNHMANPGFDVTHMLRCAPYMFGTTEMLVCSMLTVMETVVPADMYLMMFALATKSGFARSAFHRLFVYGGRDFCSTNSTESSKFTMTGVDEATNERLSEAAELARYARSLLDLGTDKLEARFRRVITKKRELDEDGNSKDVNESGETITREMRSACEYEHRLIEWYRSLPASYATDLARPTVERAPTGSRYRRGGLVPEDWGRTRDEMPEFWRVNDDLMTAIEYRNQRRAGNKESYVRFASREDGGEGYNPNYVRFSFNGRRDASAVEQAIGAYPVSAQNWNYVLHHFAQNPSSVMMRLPQLEISAQNIDSAINWRCNREGIIETQMMPAVVVCRGKHIDISTVWLMLGGWHGHVMDMLAALDDKHVPIEGRNIVLPFSSPSAPWLMQSFRLKQRPDYAIEVKNPAAHVRRMDSVIVNTVISPITESSLFAKLGEIQGAHGRNAPQSGVASRAAVTVANLLANSIRAETTASYSAEEYAAERRKLRYRRLHARLLEEYEEKARTNAALRVLNPDTEPIGEFVPPPPPRPAAISGDVSAAASGFMAPERARIAFNSYSVDDTLHAVFLSRTGQSGVQRWSMIEAAIATDTELTNESVIRLANATAAAASEEASLSTDMSGRISMQTELVAAAQENPDALYDSEDEDEYYNNPRSVDITAEELAQFQRIADDTDMDPHVVERMRYRNELTAAASILESHAEDQKRGLHSYPDPWMPAERPPWILAAEHLARLARKDSEDPLTPDDAESLGELPVYPPGFAAMYPATMVSERILYPWRNQKAAATPVPTAPPALLAMPLPAVAKGAQIRSQARVHRPVPVAELSPEFVQQSADFGF